MSSRSVDSNPPVSPDDSHWYSAVDKPIVVSSADSAFWHQRADVVVVGLGGAGVCTAIEALDGGASVIAVDRFQGGGATAMSGGIVYLGGGTEQQCDAGVKDSPTQMYNYLRMEAEDAVRSATLKRFCDSSVEMCRWLQHNGVEFDDALSPVKTSYPGNRYYLYYSGNELVDGFADRARPAPRGHRAFGRGLSGAAFYQPLKQAALAKGLELKKHSLVNRLVVDASGAVVGVEVRRIDPHSNEDKQHHWFSVAANRLRSIAPPLAAFFQRKVEMLEQSMQVEVELIRADKAVVLAAGGFVFNREMVAHYAPAYRDAMPIGSMGCNGSGIRLGQSVGAAVERMDRVSAWRFINPPLAWSQGIVVNDDGQRFCNEQVYGARLGYHMVEHNAGRATLIISGDLFWQAVKQSLPWKIWSSQALPALLNLFFNAKKANTIAQLALRCDVPEDALQATVDAYNRAAAGEQQDQYGKTAEFMQGLYSGPYYALDISVDSRWFPCPSITVGGLQVDENSGQVKDGQGGVISGLYAAGRNAVGVASNFYVSGLSIADCVFSGRRAARHITTKQ